MMSSDMLNRAPILASSRWELPSSPDVNPTEFQARHVLPVVTVTVEVGSARCAVHAAKGHKAERLAAVVGTCIAVEYREDQLDTCTAER